jgi:hypothetical protein
LWKIESGGRIRLVTSPLSVIPLFGKYRLFSVSLSCGPPWPVKGRILASGEGYWRLGKDTGVWGRILASGEGYWRLVKDTGVWGRILASGEGYWRLGKDTGVWPQVNRVPLRVTVFQTASVV